METDRNLDKKRANKKKHRDINHRKQLRKDTEGDGPSHDFAKVLFSSLGNSAISSMAGGGLIQTKLNVSSRGDRYEQQADKVAQEIVNKDPANASSPKIDAIQTHTTPGRMVGSNTEKAIQNLNGKGAPLNKSVRDYFEPRYGTDLSNVRLHTGNNADKLAGNINARAFTHGNNIVFKSGEYQPGTTKGKTLIAHELTHVLQQNNTASPTGAHQVFRQEGEEMPVSSNEAPPEIEQAAPAAEDTPFDLAALEQSLFNYYKETGKSDIFIGRNGELRYWPSDGKWLLHLHYTDKTTNGGVSYGPWYEIDDAKAWSYINQTFSSDPREILDDIIDSEPTELSSAEPENSSEPEGSSRTTPGPDNNSQATPEQDSRTRNILQQETSPGNTSEEGTSSRTAPEETITPVQETEEKKEDEIEPSTEGEEARRGGPGFEYSYTPDPALFMAEKAVRGANLGGIDLVRDLEIGSPFAEFIDKNGNGRQDEGEVSVNVLVTDTYGRTSNQQTNDTYRGGNDHAGIDFVGIAEDGSRAVPIITVYEGTVIHKQVEKEDPVFGYYVIVEHRMKRGIPLYKGDDLVFRTWYCHLASIDSSITQGSEIGKGRNVGIQGESGVGSGVHLHFFIELPPFDEGRRETLDPKTLFPEKIRQLIETKENINETANAEYERSRLQNSAESNS